MKERPIPFSGPMVRAILDGKKTQTRRVVRSSRRAPWHRPEPVLLAHRWTVAPHLRGGWWAIDVPDASNEIIAHPPGDDTGFLCPYGQPGDRLWVREHAWYDREIISAIGARRCFFEGGDVRSENGATTEKQPGLPENAIA